MELERKRSLGQRIHELGKESEEPGTLGRSLVNINGSVLVQTHSRLDLRVAPKQRNSSGLFPT
jgi:hypothetical protein